MWVCKKETVDADLFAECFNSLPPFLSCSFLSCHFFSSATVWFGQWFPGRLLTCLQSKTSISLDLLELRGIITMENAQIEAYLIAWLKLVKKYNIQCGSQQDWADWIKQTNWWIIACFIKRMRAIPPYKAPPQSPQDMKAFKWLKCYWND